MACMQFVPGAEPSTDAAARMMHAPALWQLLLKYKIKFANMNLSAIVAMVLHYIVVTTAETFSKHSPNAWQTHCCHLRL